MAAAASRMSLTSEKISDSSPADLSCRECSRSTNADEMLIGWLHLVHCTYLQDRVDVVEGVLGPQCRLEAVFDQGDEGLFLRVLNATELFSHREEVCRHLAGIHQQDGPAADTRRQRAHQHSPREKTSAFVVSRIHENQNGPICVEVLNQKEAWPP